MKWRNTSNMGQFVGIICKTNITHSHVSKDLVCKKGLNTFDKYNCVGVFCWKDHNLLFQNLWQKKKKVFRQKPGSTYSVSKNKSHPHRKHFIKIKHLEYSMLYFSDAIRSLDLIPRMSFGKLDILIIWKYKRLLKP